MDWLTSVVEMVKALAWPVAASVIALVFRQEIRTLLGRVKKGKVGPAEFEFEEIVRELKQSVDPKPADLPPGARIGPPGALRVAGEPRFVILEAWLQVEAAATQLARKHGVLDESRPHDGGLAVRLLRQKEILTWEDEKLYRELRALRNNAAHEIEFSPSVDSVLNFVHLAQRLESRLLGLPSVTNQ